MALVGTTSSSHDRKMASRNTAQQPPQSDKPERRQVAFPANTPSRKICPVRGVTIYPMTKALARAATPVARLCFNRTPQNPRTRI